MKINVYTARPQVQILSLSFEWTLMKMPQCELTIIIGKNKLLTNIALFRPFGAFRQLVPTRILVHVVLQWKMMPKPFKRESKLVSQHDDVNSTILQFQFKLINVSFWAIINR